MSLKMGVLVEMWENKTGLKVASVSVVKGQVTIRLKGRDGDPRISELAEKVKGEDGEYTGHRMHRTKHRERSWIEGADVDTHTHYQGPLKPQKKEKRTRYSKAR